MKNFVNQFLDQTIGRDQLSLFLTLFQGTHISKSGSLKVDAKPSIASSGTILEQSEATKVVT